MDDPFNFWDFGWMKSSRSDSSVDLFTDEVESDFHSSDVEEIPFACHGPVVELDHEEVSIQQDF